MPSRKTIKRKARFIHALNCGANVADAARAAGVDRSLPYKWARGDPAFARSWQQARLSAASLDRLSRQAYEMALKGNVRLLVHLLERLERQSTALRSLEPRQVQIEFLPNSSS